MLLLKLLWPPIEPPQTNDSAVPSSPVPSKPGPSTADTERHTRKCIVCNHPDREEIERAYIHWVRPYSIAREFEFDNPRPIYRHARALGLHILRRQNSHSALDLIVENAEIAKVTGDTVIRAIRASSCLDDNGRWREPPRSVIYTYTREYIASNDGANTAVSDTSGVPSQNDSNSGCKPIRNLRIFNKTKANSSF